MHLPPLGQRLPASSPPPHGALRRALSALAALLVTVATAAVVAQAAAAATNLLVNGDFSAGNTSGWTCSPGDAVVTSPVYPGDSRALAGTPASSDYAQCSQVVSVQPSSS